MKKYIEDLKTALLCCSSNLCAGEPCPYYTSKSCHREIINNSLSLIEEFTKENELLKLPICMVTQDGRIEMLPTVESVREVTEEYKITITGEKRVSVIERFISFREYLLLEGLIDALERAGAPATIKLEHVE